MAGALSLARRVHTTEHEESDVPVMPVPEGWRVMGADGRRLSA